MDLGLKNKKALVTGSSHGIGKCIALALAEEGCHVAICARNSERLDQVMSSIKSKKVPSIAIAADITQAENVDKVISEVIREWGSVDILVNNVGGGGRWGNQDILKTSENTWIEVYEKNTLTAIRFTIKVLPYMQKNKWGRVINISSIYGKEAGGRPWFNMAKSAQISMMKTLSMDSNFTTEGITFNTIAPGAIMIPDTGWEKEAQENPEAFKELLKKYPLNRLGLPEEVADVVTFVASEKASLVNGACICVDGGESRSF